MSSPSELQRRGERRSWGLLVDPLLQLTVVWCIFSFKIFLVTFGEAGMRPDDVLILASFVALAMSGRVRRTPISLPLRLYFVYVAVEFASALWNAWQGRVELLYSLVFVLRLVEYVAFYFIGYSLARSRFRLLRIVLLYAYTLCAVVPLQMIGLLPLPGPFPRSRASGNTNGPYELAIVCGFLLCYVGYRKRSYFIGTASVLLIILTASRITLIATIFSLLHFGVSRTKSVVKVAVLSSVLVLLASGVYLLSAAGVVHVGALDRLQNSSSLGFAGARSVYDSAPVAKSSKEYTEGSFADIDYIDFDNFDGDLSGFIRFTRWLTLLKTNLAHMDSILIGLGPSFGSAAVDGYFTRCFVETGVLGTLAFFGFLAALLLARRRSNWFFRDFVLIMIVSSVFIDVFLSYKSMMLLWLWHGVNQYRRRKQEDANRQHPLQLAAVSLSPMVADLPETGALGA